ncbi:MAG TPA: head GIN domain-containing protein [Chitinophagaceae bacterium]|nr:head GIN domain-containing protein [Chitinophagaceae bacterium]
MKKIFFIVSALFLAIPFNSFSQQEENKKIEGSGNIVTKDVAVQSFSELKVSGVFSLYLEQGNTESVKIEADDNFQPLFEVKNEGSKLVIKMQDHINLKTKKGSKGMKVYITFKSLKSMELSTVGNISAEKKLSFNDLEIKNNSVGSINLNLSAKSIHIRNESVGTVMLTGSADEAIIKNNGVGSLKAYDFVVQKMEINNEGIGSAEVNAEKELKVKDSFLGKVMNKGNAKRINKVVI